MIDLDSSAPHPDPGDDDGATYLAPRDEERYSSAYPSLAPVARFTLEGREITVHRRPTAAPTDAPGWRALRHACIGSAIVAGERYLLAAFVPDEAGDATEHATEVDPADVLTGRELQIVALVAAGRSNKEVAVRLHISEWTVSTHLRRVFAKLRVDSRAAMVFRCAGRLGLDP